MISILLRDWVAARVEGAGWAVRVWRDALSRLMHSVWSRFLLTIALRRNRQLLFQHELAVCAIFNNEALFLQEWLTLHHAVGVEHFYLYNDQSTDNFRGVLKPWLQRGLVTLCEWPESEHQVGAYNDCIKRFRMHSRWIAFLDLDEFLFSPETRDLKRALLRYDGAAAIFVSWCMFGSNGHEIRPQGSVIENYIRCMGIQDAHANCSRTWRIDGDNILQTTGNVKNGKSIVNPRLIRVAGVHRPSQILWGNIVDENGCKLTHDLNVNYSYSILRINHYWSKSQEDLLSKVRRKSRWFERNRRWAPVGAPSLPVLPEHLFHEWLRVEKTLNSTVDLTLLEIWRTITASK